MFLDILKAILLGVVEGITEFLPISSTGHLILVGQFLKFDSQSFKNMFDVVIQLGAILSVVVYFWQRLNPFHEKKTAVQKAQTWEIWKKTLVGVIPALVLGKLFGDIIEEKLFNPYVVAVTLLVWGVVLIWLEKREKVAKITSISQLSYATAIGIGFIQCLAMVPGTSRSAATIIGAMLLGSSRMVAAEFSFFLAIPTMAAASGYTLLKNGLSLSSNEWVLLFVGFVVSFIVAWAVIAAFMKYITRNNFIPFAYYRIALAILVFVLGLMGIIQTGQV